MWGALLRHWKCVYVTVITEYNVENVNIIVYISILTVSSFSIPVLDVERFVPQYLGDVERFVP